MGVITVNGIEYDSDSLSENAKKQLSSIKYVKEEISKLEAKFAVLKTAEAAYAKALKDELEAN